MLDTCGHFLWSEVEVQTQLLKSNANSFYKKMVSCGLVMTGCGCSLHAAVLRPLGWKMFRKPTTTGVATRQLACSLESQAAPLVLRFLFSNFSTSFIHLCSLLFFMFCLTLASCVAFMSYLNPPSSHHQTNTHITDKHGRTCTKILQKQAQRQGFSGGSTCFNVNTHTHTLLSDCVYYFCA